MNMHRRELILGMFALPICAACVSVPATSDKLNKTGWKTYCFGRYLVDLPPDAGINAKYKIWGDEIV
jgi:hypothetical protein